MRVLSIAAGALLSATLLQVPMAGAEEKSGRSQIDRSRAGRVVMPSVLQPAVPGLLPPSVSESVAPRNELPHRTQPAKKIREAAKRAKPSLLLRVSTPARALARPMARRAAGLGIARSGLAGRGIAASVVRPRIPAGTRRDRLLSQAHKGDPVAQYHVGRMYRTGAGVNSDAAMAMTWFKRAAQNNLAAAHYHIGLMRMAGENGRPDIVEAYARFKMAAGGGDVRAAAFLFYIGVRMTAKELRQSQTRLGDLRRLSRAVAATATAK